MLGFVHQNMLKAKLAAESLEEIMLSGHTQGVQVEECVYTRELGTSVGHPLPDFRKRNNTSLTLVEY
ncbi:hypothetical protein AAHA92_26342 [Salvia divinorum]|uniref:Uncharacterized protein n=1 Tax=Salvia divinorum TaxID=28513 RepID=A0ABD1GGV2_SALDI